MQILLSPYSPACSSRSAVLATALHPACTSSSCHRTAWPHRRRWEFCARGDHRKSSGTEHVHLLRMLRSPTDRPSQDKAAATCWSWSTASNHMHVEGGKTRLRRPASRHVETCSAANRSHAGQHCVDAQCGFKLPARQLRNTKQCGWADGRPAPSEVCTCAKDARLGLTASGRGPEKPADKPAVCHENSLQHEGSHDVPREKGWSGPADSETIGTVFCSRSDPQGTYGCRQPCLEEGHAEAGRSEACASAVRQLLPRLNRRRVA